MYAVGLDVDTFRVSFLNVSSVIIIWLYAGIFLYYCPVNVDGIINNICIKIINTEEQSAGNLEIAKVSEHFPKHKKPETDFEFGYYIAGLIEGDGYIGERGFEIVFHEQDVNNAYYIKKRIGYGTISKIKEKKAYKLMIFHKRGVEKLFHLCNGKFQGQYKIIQLFKHQYNIKFNTDIIEIDNSNILNTYWLCGFTDADGNFSIFISNSKTHKYGKNITLPFRFTQKYPDLLYKIKKAFNGGVIYSSNNYNSNCYRYSTITFKRAIIVENYFNKYHLVNDSKYLRYTY